ncbi:MAG: S8 family serine peptidase [Gemmatimonadetes bacterium]|nr:S8 family serine peptidase [Gemmatimonadota bacterium]
MWPALRDFLNVPEELTGKGVRIAIVDGDFPNHPDITTNPHRTTYKVMVMDPNPGPKVFNAEPGPWKGGAHGLWAAAAAAGSGAESWGLFKGLAPDADLFLIAQYFRGQGQQPEKREEAHLRSLEWIRDNWRKYEIRGVLSARRSVIDASLLPWQADPVRVLCEEIASEGVLVVSGSGNIPDRTVVMAEAAAPSVLSVGGVVIPSNGDPGSAGVFPGCRGTTFEGKWIPEILAPAENIVLPHGTDEEIEQHYYGKMDELPRRYARLHGTSYAGPMVLGAAACLWQVRPEWTSQEMKSALVESSMQRPGWTDLRAGLVSVRAALGSEPSATRRDPVIWPRQIRTVLRSLSVASRLGMLGDSEPDHVIAAILSFVGVEDALPDEVLIPFRTCLRHSDPRVRAAALCALAMGTSPVNASEIAEAFRDDSPFVRAAIIYLLCNHSDLWSECAKALPELFDDTNPDVRYAALQLALQMTDPRMAGTILAGLEEDARANRISSFGARRDALEAITGHRLDITPPYRHGEPFYSDERRLSRLDLARRWNEWIREEWLPGRA